MRIAFIGLGNMGALMARNLLKVDHVFSMLSLNMQAVDALAEAGVVAAVSSRDVVTDVETVITVLSVAAYVRHVLTAEDGVLTGTVKGMPIIDSSTIGPAGAKASGAMAAGYGDPFVDAPVSGGTSGAVTGTLTFMVDGSTVTFEQMCPVLSATSKGLVHCDDTGAGQGTKICSSLVFGITVAGVAETMSPGEVPGVDPGVLGGIINTSTRHCRSSDTYNSLSGVTDTAPPSHGYAGGLGIDLMLRDLGLAGDAAKSVRQPVYLGASAQRLHQTVGSKGDGKLNFSVIIKLYRKDGAA